MDVSNIPHTKHTQKKHYTFFTVLPEVPEVRKRPEPEKKVPVPKKVEAPPTKGTYINYFLKFRKNRFFCFLVSNLLWGRIDELKLTRFVQQLLVPDTCLNHLVVCLQGEMCVLLVFSVPPSKKLILNSLHLYKILWFFKWSRKFLLKNGHHQLLLK